jgi:hypothetical protein
MELIRFYKRTALRVTEFLTGVHRLLVINMQQSDFTCESTAEVKVVLLSNKHYVSPPPVNGPDVQCELTLSTEYVP